jgi:membrane protease YdiL (CAAX protease family)
MPLETPPAFMAGKDEKQKMNTIGKSLFLYVGIQFSFSFAFSMILGVVISLIAGVIMYRFSIYQAGSILHWLSSNVTSLLLLLVTIASSGIAILYLKNKLSLSFYKEEYAPKVDGKLFCKGAGCMFLFSLAGSLIMLLINLIFSPIGFEISTPSVDSGSGLISGLLTFITLVIAAPLFEETFFRGCILKSLRRYGDWFALAVSSMIFGMMHMNLAQSIITAFMGLVFGYCYIKTGKLSTSIALHALNNGIAFLSMYSWGSMISNIALIAFAIFGCFVLFEERKNLKAFYVQNKSSFSIKNAFQAIWMKGFVVVFVIMCIYYLFF